MATYYGHSSSNYAGTELDPFSVADYYDKWFTPSDIFYFTGSFYETT